MQYDMITATSSWQQNIVGLFTGKEYAIQYRDDDGSWHPMDRTSASEVWYNADLLLIIYGYDVTCRAAFAVLLKIKLYDWVIKYVEF